MSGEAPAPIDVAKDAVNERLLRLGMNETFQSYAPAYTGLPISYDEGEYILKVVAQDLTESVVNGVPYPAALSGCLHWILLLGILAGKGPDADRDEG